MPGGFQTQVSNQPALGIQGDFASVNPYFSYDAGPGGLVAGGPAGVTIGRFAWVYPPVDANGTGKVVQNSGSGPVAGFVHRNQQGLITDFLAYAGMIIKPGYAMALLIGGDFLVINDGAAQALVGMKAYANFANGKVRFAATGSPAVGASGSASDIAAATNSWHGGIVGDLLTVTVLDTGTIRPGTTIASGAAAGTKIVSQVSGTPGGVGTYLVSIPEQTVAPGTAMNGTYGILTVGGTVVGLFEVGEILNATGAVVAGTKVTQLITGDGGLASTLAVDNNTVVSSQAISTQGDVETKWYATSSGLAGEIIKITDHPAG